MGKSLTSQARGFLFRPVSMFETHGGVVHFSTCRWFTEVVWLKKETVETIASA